jgi:outer membrane immunogenic protein
MKKLLGGIAISALLAAPALAADLPARMPVKAAPAPVVAVFSWTGCYIGAQAGWVRTRDRQDMTNNVGSFRLITEPHDSSWVAGGHVGCNLQTGQWVFGIEGDIEAKGIDHSYVPGPPFSATTVFTYESKVQGSVRGRLGYAVDRVLFYATGGAAVARFKHTYFTPAAFFDSNTDTRWGWTVGGGLEYAFTGNWSGRVEYRYSNYGTERVNLPNFLAPPGWSDVRIDEHAVRAGISYRFGGPVVARY